MTWSASAASAPYQCPGRWQCTCWCTRWAWHLRRWVDCSEDATTKRSPMESPEFPQKYSGTQSSDMTCRPSESVVPGVLFRGRRVQQAWRSCSAVHHAEGHSGRGQDLPTGLWRHQSTRSSRSGRPRTPSTRSGIPRSNAIFGPSATSSTATCRTRPWRQTCDAKPAIVVDVRQHYYLFGHLQLPHDILMHAGAMVAASWCAANTSSAGRMSWPSATPGGAPRSCQHSFGRLT